MTSITQYTVILWPVCGNPFLILRVYFTFAYVYRFMYVNECTSACRAGLQVVGSHPVWALGTEIQSSTRAEEWLTAEPSHQPCIFSRFLENHIVGHLLLQVQTLKPEMEVSQKLWSLSTKLSDVLMQICMDAG